VSAEADGLRGLGRLLDPSSLVLVGASERRPDVVRTATKGVRAWLVNPRREEVAERPCYPSVAALPEVPDVAMVLVGAATVEAAVSEALAVQK
jgi:acyl-CoA synthetase (NDP forming)